MLVILVFMLVTASAFDNHPAQAGWGDDEADAGPLNRRYDADAYAAYSVTTRQNLARLAEAAIDYELLEAVVLHIDESHPEGAVLVFLPGAQRCPTIMCSRTDQFSVSELPLPLYAYAVLLGDTRQNLTCLPVAAIDLLEAVMLHSTRSTPGRHLGVSATCAAHSLWETGRLGRFRCPCRPAACVWGWKAPAAHEDLGESCQRARCRAQLRCDGSSYCKSRALYCVAVSGMVDLQKAHEAVAAMNCNQLQSIAPVPCIVRMKALA